MSDKVTPVAMTEVPVPPLVSSSAAMRSDADEGAAVCAFIVARRVLSCTRLANDLGTRPIVIEECIRQGYSSRALRAQLSHYLQEHSAVSSRLPGTMVQALQQAHARDVAPLQAGQTAATISSRESTMEEENMLAMLDPSSKNHFLALESAVGQGFSSIMNDPAGARAGGANRKALGSNDNWGGWFGEKLSSAFDYGSHGNTGNRAEEALTTLRAGYQTNDQSSVMLLAEHAPDGGFDDYVRMISAAYAENHKESQSTGSSVFGRAKCKVEDLPWPQGVPAEVFDRQYEPRSELQRLPVNAPSSAAHHSSVATAPPPAPGTDPTGRGTEAAQGVPGRKVIERDAFVKDTERLESRASELRAWEAEVERCLLEHVRSRSEDFFSASLQFTLLSGGAGDALSCARTSRLTGVAPAQTVVKKYLEVGVLHRRRQNYQALSELVSKVENMRGRLERVENWVALQERDMSELPKFVENLLRLQQFLADHTRQGAARSHEKKAPDAVKAPGDAGPAGRIHSGWVTRLKCLQDVPSRVAQVDKAMKDLVVHTIIAHFTASSSSLTLTTHTNVSASVQNHTTLVQTCEAATALGVLDRALHAYQNHVVQSIWAQTQTAVLNTLMNTDSALTDEAADKLFTLSAACVGTAAAESAPSPPPSADRARKSTTSSPEQASAKDPAAARKAFLELVASQVRFPIFLVLFSQLQEGLCEYATHVAQQLAALLVDYQTAASPRNHAGGNSNPLGSLHHVCEPVLTAMRGEMEYILAQMITLREQHMMPSDAKEVESLVEASYRWTSLLAEPLTNLEQMHDRELTGLCRSVLTAGKSPVRTACQKLCRHYFRAWHAQQIEKLTMVLDNETWEARDDINALFQSHLGELCRSDMQAVQTFDALSLEPDSDTLAGPHAAPARSRRSTVAGTAISLSSTLNGHSGKGGGVGTVDEDDILLTTGTVNRLFLSLDDDRDSGRVVCGAFLILVEQLFSYDQYVAHFPSVALETTVHMQELLARFDAKTASLVLGAKAVEKGTLRSISTQHLCVASQCVALLSEFIPLLQQRLLRVFHTKKLVADADDTATAPAAPPASSDAASKLSARLRPFIEKDMTRTIKDARAHRNECYQKIVSLVKAKVDSLGRVEPTGVWPTSGNEWVMTMLRETARLLRALKPYLPELDIQGVVAPLLGIFAGEIREVTRVIPEKATDARASAMSDVLLFRANVEKFGYDVLLCAATTSPATAMRGALAPQSSEQAIVDWFFPKPRAASTTATSASSNPPS